MKLETGYVYHIKNDFFTFASDNKLKYKIKEDVTQL